MAAIDEASIDQLLAQYERVERRKGLIYTFFPAEGPYRRELYPQHMYCFKAGKIRSSRLMMAANGVGKTILGAFEYALHLTGLYPDWWPGYRYQHPPRFWIAGKTLQTTRDNQQKLLLGRPKAEAEGGGMVPTDLIDFDSLQRWPSGGGLIESVRIRHVSGGMSEVGVRTYDQALDAWFGENLDGGWLDEPAPVLHYSELYTRTRSSAHPLILCTHTPMHGATELVNLFVNEPAESRELIPCAWEDVPHLTDEWKQGKLENTPEYMHNTVKKGIPALGIGAVYPIPEENFIIDPLEEIPDHWPRAIGFDGGWHNTAAVWGAWDRETDTWYLYDEHKAGKLVIPVHAAAIASRVKGPMWIPIVGDCRHTNVNDGKRMIDEYADNGIDIIPADKPGKEARIEKVRKGLLTGKIKVYRTLRNWRQEYRMYHYDDKGKLVKENDHEMDATQHLIDQGPMVARTHSEVVAVASAKDRPVRFGRRI